MRRVEIVVVGSGERAVLDMSMFRRRETIAIQFNLQWVFVIHIVERQGDMSGGGCGERANLDTSVF